MYEVYYCNPLEFDILKVEDGIKVNEESSVFLNFSDAKKNMLEKLRADKQLFSDAISKVSKMKKSECS